MLDAHFQKTNFDIAMTLSTWIMKQMTNKNNAILLIFSIIIKAISLKVGPFFCAHSLVYGTHDSNKTFLLEAIFDKLFTVMTDMK